MPECSARRVPEVNFVGLANSFEVPAQRANKPSEFRKALAKARTVTAQGRHFLIDARIMQLGIGADENWHPDVSIAAGCSIDV